MPDANVVSRFDEIYDSTKKPVLALITAKCGLTADIADIFQETYMELYMVLNKRGAEYVINEKAFVSRLARQKLSRHYKLLDRLRVFIPLTSTDEDSEDVELSGLEADGFLTEDFAVDNIMLATARQFILSKPETVKKVLYLFYDAGLTIPEIARALAISESGVKNHLYRTLNYRASG